MKTSRVLRCSTIAVMREHAARLPRRMERPYMCPMTEGPFPKTVHAHPPTAGPATNEAVKGLAKLWTYPAFRLHAYNLPENEMLTNIRVI